MLFSLGLRRAKMFNPLNAELNPNRHLLALVGARHIVHVSRIMVNILKYHYEQFCRLGASIMQ
jgi:hypothetical protein